MQHLIILETDDSGHLVPVQPQEAASDYAGYTAPPVPLSRVRMAQWRAYRMKLIRQGEHPQMAWYKACCRFANPISNANGT